MIANPNEIRVEVLSGADVEDKTCSIVVGNNERPAKADFVMLCDGHLIARSQSARALSRWALEQNAKAVRFDFDLRWER